MPANEYFQKAAENYEEAGGHYNLGVMFLKGIGVKKDVKLACKYFIVAANAGQPKSILSAGKDVPHWYRAKEESSNGMCSSCYTFICSYILFFTPT